MLSLLPLEYVSRDVSLRCEMSQLLLLSLFPSPDPADHPRSQIVVTALKQLKMFAESRSDESVLRHIEIEPLLQHLDQLCCVCIL